MNVRSLSLRILQFGLMCEENKWMLTMVGSVHNFGKFIGIPVWGIVSDKFGRKFTMVFGTVMAALTYIVQSFSTCYPMFLILELVCSIFFSGVFAATFILGMESVLPGKRVLFYMVLGCFGPVGGMSVPLIASQVKDWRLLLRLFNVPALLFLSYYWLTDESMRWLEMRGRHDEVIGVLEKIATMNKKPLADLPRAPPLKSKNSDAVEANAKPVSTNTSILKEVIRSPTIFWRMIRCSFTWIASTLVYYGLNISSADIAGNKYLNFSLVVMVEIPAALLGWVIMERMSRKMSLSCMFMVSAISCIVYNLTPDHLGLTVKMFLFMISKLSISIAFSIVYIQTVEIFPTTMRVTMLSLCSMIGRLGSMLAPQITLLSEYFGEYTVMLLMGTTAFTAAVITLTLPESKNVKLPDTIDDAERIDNCLPLTELNPN
uniref:Solute carrier family 22 member 21 n=1 Tax=Sipha flava TaxID=143950 RepID=A0A2S2R819_9HEMI